MSLLTHNVTNLSINLNWDTAQFISITFSLTLWLCIYTPLLLFHSCRYCKNRRHVVYRARYSNITVYESVFVITKIIFDCIDSLFYALAEFPSLYAEIFNVGNTFLNYLVIYCWIWRIWMISYEIVWTECLMEHEWKHVINASYLETSHEYHSAKAKWYITNRATFGNIKWVGFRFFLLVLFSSIINAFCNVYSVLYYSNNMFDLYIIQLLGLFPMMIPYIMLIIIYCITPLYFDNFYILTEIKLIIMCLLLDYFVAYVAYTLFFAFYQPNPNSDIAKIVISISFQIGVFSQFLCLLFSTCWVNKKLSNIANNKYYNRISRRETTTTFSRTGTIDIVNGDECLLHIHPKTTQKGMKVYNQYELNIKDIISYKVTLELFVNHLSSEFIIESILSFIEMLQFQTLCLQRKNNFGCDGGIILSDIYIFTKSMPKSQIVYNKHDDLRRKA
eukprot:385851_1